MNEDLRDVLERLLDHFGTPPTTSVWCSFGNVGGEACEEVDFLLREIAGHLNPELELDLEEDYEV